MPPRRWNPATSRRSIKIPGTNTSFQVGGFVRLDAIWDIGAGGVGLDTVNAALARGATGVGTNLNQFWTDRLGLFGLTCNDVPFLCTTGDSRANNRFNGGNVRMHGRLSRFWFKSWTPTDYGEIYTHIAADFLNSSEAGGGLLRLRQAYGQFGPITAGFLELNFRPVLAESETLDFGGTVGYAAVRKTQIRYTHRFNANTNIAFSLEDPSDSIGDADQPYSLEMQNAGITSNPRIRQAAQRMPEIVGSFTHRFTNAHIWVAGILRMIEHDTGGEPYSFALSGTHPVITTIDTRASAARRLGWGVAIAGSYDFTPQFSVGAHGFIGKGIGSYVGSQGDNTSVLAGGPQVVTSPLFQNITKAFQASPSAFHDALILGPNNIRTILSYGGFIWGRYQVTDTMRVNVAYGYALQEIEKALPYALGGFVTFPFTSGTITKDQSSRKNYLVGNTHYMYSIHGNFIWSPVPQVDFGIEYVHLFVARFKGEQSIYFLTNDRNALISRLLVAMMYRF